MHFRIDKLLQPFQLFIKKNAAEEREKKTWWRGGDVNCVYIVRRASTFIGIKSVSSITCALGVHTLLVCARPTLHVITDAVVS